MSYDIKTMTQVQAQQVRKQMLQQLSEIASQVQKFEEISDQPF